VPPPGSKPEKQSTEQKSNQGEQPSTEQKSNQGEQPVITVEEIKITAQNLRKVPTINNGDKKTNYNNPADIFNAGFANMNVLSGSKSSNDSEAEEDTSW
jgi:hypothetical protein